MFNVNILIICITVLIALVIVSATALACVEKCAEVRRPRSFAEIIGGIPDSGKEGSDE